MKTLILITLFTITAWAYSSFCRGYENGYKEGYCYQNFSCITPITPICPIPYIGEDGYSDGYNRGFMDGVNDK